MKTFYVCSFGGSGSTMLYRYLRNFGKAYHIHSRAPPDMLSHVGNDRATQPTYSEWFNTTPLIDAELANTVVIFIYRNPVDVIMSRCVCLNQRGAANVNHQKHIQCPNRCDISIQDIIQSREDLFGLESFFDTYTTSRAQRNYPIICIKYESLFDNWHRINKLLHIPNVPSLYPTRKETTRHIPEHYKTVLYEIYAPLINKMNKMAWCHIVGNSLSV